MDREGVVWLRPAEPQAHVGSRDGEHHRDVVGDGMGTERTQAPLPSPQGAALWLKVWSC